MSDFEVRIEPISRHHIRNRFRCGNPFLDTYLVRYARQNAEKGLARAYVATLAGDHTVIGYYTLSASHILFESTPPELVKNLPRYPVPAARIGELAVDISYQGKGLGGVLLIDAISNICKTAERIGILAIVVDAMDDAAARFYQHYGFERFGPGSRQIYLTINDASAWIA